MIEWKDTSSYSQRDIERIPKTWTAKIGTVDLVLTRIVHLPDTWFWKSRSLGVDTIELHSKNVEEAKREALQQLNTKLKSRIESYQEAVTQIESGEEIT